MRSIFGILISCILVFNAKAMGVPTAITACTEAQASSMGASIEKNKNWDGLYKSFQSYPKCRGQNVIEVYGAYSDVIAELLAEHWDTFFRLFQLTKSSPDFKRFVLKHVEDETIPQDLLRKIKKNADEKCPRSAENLCMKIAKKTLP